MKHSEVVIFDIETTGLNKSTDRIIEFAASVFDWETLNALPVTVTKDMLVQKAKLNIKRFFLPADGTESSLGAYYKHHLSREVLKDQPDFKEFAQECFELFTGRDTISYNGMSCDIPFVSAELKRYGYTVDWSKSDHYDSFLTELDRHPNRLEGAYERYTGTTMELAGLNAHDAFSDVIATISVFNAQNKDSYQEPSKYVTDDGFLKISDVNIDGKNPEKCIVFANGKNAGIPVKVVVQKDPGYISWVLASDFSERTKMIINKFLQLYK